LGKLREVTKNLTQGGWYPSQDLNWTLSKYKPGVLQYTNLFGDGGGGGAAEVYDYNDYDDDKSWVLCSCNYTFKKCVTDVSPLVLLKHNTN